MKFNVNADTRAAERMFSNAIKAVENSTKPLKDTRKMQLREIDNAFNVAGKNITGQPWKKLRPNYLKSKIASGFLTPILVRTGKMRKSFKSIELKKDSLKVTSVGVPYFKDHQLGKSGGTFKARLPRRQMLGHSKAMIDKTLKIFGDYIYKKIKNG